MFKKGDLVTRESYGNDILFEVVDVNGNTVSLKGVDYRLIADSNISDLNLCSDRFNNDIDIVKKNKRIVDLDRKNYFYLPGKILHIDGDESYLNRCLEYYKNIGIKAVGISMKESDIPDNINKLLKKEKPNILVVTGHDAYMKKRIGNIDLYKNSKSFMKAVQVARSYEKDYESLIIIAGACQSNFEGLLTSGANFASSPKRINIHALDPAIIASELALCDRCEYIDLIETLNKTNTGSDGIGGIKTKGTMFVGYPRNGDKNDSKN